MLTEGWTSSRLKASDGPAVLERRQARDSKSGPAGQACSSAHATGLSVEIR